MSLAARPAASEAWYTWLGSVRVRVGVRDRGMVRVVVRVRVRVRGVAHRRDRRGRDAQVGGGEDHERVAYAADPLSLLA